MIAGKLCANIYALESLKVQLVPILSGQSVVQVHCISQHKPPKCLQNGLGPPAFCMKQLLPCLILEVPDYPLGVFILEVCIHAAVTDVLVVVHAMINECIVSKLAVIGMILFDLNVMTWDKFFKGNVHLNRLV